MSNFNLAEQDFEKWFAQYFSEYEPSCSTKTPSFTKEDLQRAYSSGYETGVVAGAMDSNELVRIVERTEHIIVRRRQDE